jgi:hypothetical protein
MKPRRDKDSLKPTRAVGAGATENADTMPPIFAFEKMQDGSGYSINCCNAEHQSAALKKMFLLSKMTWREITQAPRHGLGTEKLERGAIKAAIPVNITEDVTFLALRYHGKAPMVGYRDGRIFHLVFLDHDFTLYAH